MRPFRQLPPGRRLGINLVGRTIGDPLPESYGGDPWARWWHEDFEDFLDQIDLIADLRLFDLVRVIGPGPDLIWSGLGTLEEVLGKQRLIAAKCASRGKWYYPAFTFYSLLRGANGGIAGIAEFQRAQAAALASFPNVYAIDLCSEANLLADGGYVPDADLDSLMTACRVAVRSVFPDVPVSTSISKDAAPASLLSDPAIVRVIEAGADFLDVHLYRDASPGDLATLHAQAGAAGMAVFLGESGQQRLGARAARVAATAALVASDPLCRGWALWSSVPQDTLEGSNDWGLFDGATPAAPRSDYLNALTPLRVAPRLAIGDR